MKYFTSDTHFGHYNIIKYCSRPFASTAEMDAVMMANLQPSIGEDDELYFLGDWAMNVLLYAQIKNIRFKHLYFILGNHDRPTKLGAQLSLDGLSDKVTVAKEMTTNLDGRPIHLVHRPMEASDEMATLCGHVHEKWLCQRPGALITEYKNHQKREPRILKQPILNVGVDMHGFRPISAARVIELLDSTEP
ncbi:MAG: hypothetical protein FJ146_16455 [Deltaproteobacteria bacterium]|nr:hypothetical protein [Deltaproteobacteria bacterium]